jgi:formate-nitrite transporter family protein
VSLRRKLATLIPPVTGRDHSMGPDDAPLTVVEYGDYQCPYCKAAHPILKEVRRMLGTRLRFVFRNFPLSQLHPEAQHAAEAAEAAGAQGKFWPMHDLLFDRQWALDDEHLVEYAEDLGLDGRRVSSELEDGTHRSRVRDDFMSGVRSGVNGTPTFFINGIRYDGGHDLASLVEALGAPARPDAEPVPPAG